MKKIIAVLIVALMFATNALAYSNDRRQQYAAECVGFDDAKTSLGTWCIVDPNIYTSPDSLITYRDLCSALCLVKELAGEVECDNIFVLKNDEQLLELCTKYGICNDMNGQKLNEKVNYRDGNGIIREVCHIQNDIQSVESESDFMTQEEFLLELYFDIHKKYTKIENDKAVAGYIVDDIIINNFSYVRSMNMTR